MGTTENKDAAFAAWQQTNNAQFNLLMGNLHGFSHDIISAREYLAKAVAALDAVINTNE